LGVSEELCAVLVHSHFTVRTIIFTVVLTIVIIAVVIFFNLAGIVIPGIPTTGVTVAITIIITVVIAASRTVVLATKCVHNLLFLLCCNNPEAVADKLLSVLGILLLTLWVLQMAHWLDVHLFALGTLEPPPHLKGKRQQPRHALFNQQVHDARHLLQLLLIVVWQPSGVHKERQVSVHNMLRPVCAVEPPCSVRPGHLRVCHFQPPLMVLIGLRPSPERRCYKCLAVLGSCLLGALLLWNMHSEVLLKAAAGKEHLHFDACPVLLLLLG